MSAISISELWLYPVKSLAGIRLDSALLTQAGIAGDRQWMIVDQQGRFVSQRKLPALATITTTLAADGTLKLRNASGSSISVDSPTGPSRPVQVWRDVCLGKAAADEANRWLTEAAGSDTPLTLVKFDQQQPRPTDAERFGHFTTHFADAAPLLVANSASLEALNLHLAAQGETPVDMRRFRPNIVINGLPAFAEHQCIALRCAEFELGLIDHCQRCSVITVDQSTGIANRNTTPFKQLAQINSMPDKPKAPAFGVNSVVLAGDGATIRCGVEVRDVRRSEV